MASIARNTIVARLRAAGCVYAEQEADLLLATGLDAPALAALVEQRVAGLPLEHVLGWADFAGLRIAVRPGVFVPRRRTEFLVAQAAAALRPGAVIVDLCCGSGAVGLAIAARTRHATLHAVDRDPIAVRCARENLAAVGGQVHAGDLYAPLPRSLRQKVDVIAANAPYVPSGELALLPREARVHEPSLALDGGADGLEVARRVVASAQHWLVPGGRVLIEASTRQAAALTAFMAEHGLDAVAAHSDEFDATVVVGTTTAAG